MLFRKIGGFGVRLGEVPVCVQTTYASKHLYIDQKSSKIKRGVHCQKWMTLFSAFVFMRYAVLPVSTDEGHWRLAFVFCLFLSLFGSRVYLQHLGVFVSMATTQFRVIDRNAGTEHPVSYRADPRFCFHHINGYEAETDSSRYLVVDMVASKEATIYTNVWWVELTDFFLSLLRKVEKNAQALKRLASVRLLGTAPIRGSVSITSTVTKRKPTVHDISSLTWSHQRRPRFTRTSGGLNWQIFFYLCWEK